MLHIFFYKQNLRLAIKVLLFRIFVSPQKRYYSAVSILRHTSRGRALSLIEKNQSINIVNSTNTYIQNTKEKELNNQKKLDTKNEKRIESHK